MRNFRKSLPPHSFPLLTCQTAGAPVTAPTREGDVESLVGDGEVRQEADLSRVVSKQAGAQGRRQRGARQPPEGLGEAAVLRHQQMIVRALQVEGVEGELDACTTEGRGSGQNTFQS